MHFVYPQAGVRFPNQPATEEGRCAWGEVHIPSRVGPTDARKEMLLFCVLRGKDKCATCVGSSAGRGQRRGALKTEK